jgi:hypothetical protein
LAGNGAIYTEKFGNSIGEQFPRAMKFTTDSVIRKLQTQIDFNAFPSLNIGLSTRGLRTATQTNIFKELEKVSLNDTATLYAPVESLSPHFGTVETDVLHVESVSLPNPVPVYDLTVEDDHEFYANGILVHNCMSNWRYAMVNIDKIEKTGNRSRTLPGGTGKIHKTVTGAGSRRQHEVPAFAPNNSLPVSEQWRMKFQTQPEIKHGG